MTPEELAAYREWVRISNFESNTWPQMGLSHIDQQAARIAELEAQVAALQEIAADQKAAHIAFVGFHRNMNEDETKNKAQDEARRQLAKEHPGAFR